MFNPGVSVLSGNQIPKVHYRDTVCTEPTYRLQTGVLCIAGCKMSYFVSLTSLTLSLTVLTCSLSGI